MGVHGGPDIITDGLKLSLDPKDEICNGGKSVMTDLSGNLNSGSIYSGVGVTFDGSDDYITIGDQSAYDLTSGDATVVVG